MQEIFLLVDLLLFAAAMLALPLHKTKRIHLAMYQFFADTAQTKLETERLFGQLQLQSLLAVERLVGMPRAFPAKARQIFSCEPLRKSSPGNQKSS